jgi:nucleotide-binding universal stress UspA family protein
MFVRPQNPKPDRLKNPAMPDILVPVDLSPLSDKAFRFATLIAGKLQCGITLLHVVPASGEVLVDIAGNLIDTEDFDTSAISKSIHESQTRLHEWADRISEMPVKTLSRPGQTEAVILQEIISGDYCLVVMGTHGATGMKEFFLGSHTEHIAMKSPVPVLSVKDTEMELKKVVFASSFSGTMQLPPVIGTLCKALEAEVTFLHIRTLSDSSGDLKIYQNMDRTAEASGISPHHKVVFAADGIEEGIDSYCEQHHTGLLAVESKGRSGITKWVSGCVSADLINHYEHALLTYKASN